MNAPSGARPTMRQLEYLAALDTHGHIGRAASACFVSQPTISAQIRELEKHIGASVVERVGRGVAMTSLGHELAERARAILRDTDQLLESAHRSSTTLTGILRLSAIPTVAPYLLPRVLPAMRRRHPAAELRLGEARTDSLSASLAAADIDLGLLVLPAEDGRFEHAAILDDRLLLAMAPHHRLAGEDRVPMELLEGETVLLLDDGHNLRDQAQRICDRVGAHGDSNLQGTSLVTVCRMVAAGMGVTLLPACARDVEAREGTGLVVRPFRDADLFRQVVLMWRRTAPAADLYRELAEIMAAELAQEPGGAGAGVQH